MRNLFLLILLPSIFITCNNENNIENNHLGLIDESSDSERSLLTEGCYFLSLQRDTLLVQITGTGDTIQGNLLFDNFEKDGSRGTITGTLSRDTLKTWYNFESEGMKSVMQVYFLVKETALIRGVGSMDVKEDTAYFSNLSDIYYPADNTYQKTDCNNFQPIF